MLRSLRAARQLDRKLRPLKRLQSLDIGRSGWIRTIRSALGMSQADVARHLKVSQPTVEGYERAEAAGAITLASLRRVADALDCDLVYGFVPRRGLAASIQTRARWLAEQILRRTSHTMRLEAQGVSAAETRQQIDELARALASRPPRGFWRDRR